MRLKVYPHPLLSKKCNKVVVFDTSVGRLIHDMVDLMVKSRGVALAANQAGLDKQILIIQRKTTIFPMINPKILKMSENLIEHVEGCLSLPGKEYKVKRPDSVKIEYQDILGKTIQVDLKGDIVCQAFFHEFDHLNGKLLSDVGELV